MKFYIALGRTLVNRKVELEAGLWEDETTTQPMFSLQDKITTNWIEKKASAFAMHTIAAIVNSYICLGY